MKTSYLLMQTDGTAATGAFFVIKFKRFMYVLKSNQSPNRDIIGGIIFNGILKDDSIRDG